MPYRWDIAILEGASRLAGDAVYATPPGTLSRWLDRSVLLAIWDSGGLQRPKGVKTNLVQTITSALIDQYEDRIAQDTPADFELALVDALRHSLSQARYDTAQFQQAVKTASSQATSRVRAATGLTAIAVAIEKGTLYLAYTGNNYAFLVRNRQLTALTSANASQEVSHTQIRLKRGDRLLLCSDGLRTRLTDSEITQTLTGKSSPKDALAALITTAARSNPSGNIAAGIVYSDLLYSGISTLGMLGATALVVVLMVVAVLATGALNRASVNKEIIPVPTITAFVMPSVTPTSPPTIDQSVVITPTAPTRRPTSTLPPTYTPVPMPSATPAPTDTPTPTLTPTRLPRNTPTLTPPTATALPPTVAPTPQPPPPPPPAKPTPTICPPGAICH